MVSMKTIQEQKGVVTFLDVLGWKGVWQRNEEHDPANALESIAHILRNQAKERSRGLFNTKSKSENGNTEVTIISDTIVICTIADDLSAVKAIDLHGALCQLVLPESVNKGIPLRGATSYGSYSVSEGEKIFIGKAIDEAASWHELGD